MFVAFNQSNNVELYSSLYRSSVKKVCHRHASDEVKNLDGSAARPASHSQAEPALETIQVRRGAHVGARHIT